VEDGLNLFGLLRKSELLRQYISFNRPASILDLLPSVNRNQLHSSTASRLIGSFLLGINFFVKIKIEEFYSKRQKKAHAALPV
jgi:hypothetical protein